jgi:hypothetical protein
VVDVLEAGFLAYRSHIEDWEPVIAYFQHDTYSSSYKYRITSMRGLKVFAARMEGQFEVFHHVFERLIVSQEEVETVIAFQTIREMVRFHHTLTFINKFVRLDFSAMDFRKMRMLLGLLFSLQPEFLGSNDAPPYLPARTLLH